MTVRLTENRWSGDIYASVHGHTVATAYAKPDGTYDLSIHCGGPNEQVTRDVAMRQLEQLTGPHDSIGPSPHPGVERFHRHEVRPRQIEWQDDYLYHHYGVRDPHAAVVFVVANSLSTASPSGIRIHRAASEPEAWQCSAACPELGGVPCSGWESVDNGWALFERYGDEQAIWDDLEGRLLALREVVA